MVTNDTDGIHGVPRSMDVLEVLAWVVGLGSLVLVSLNLLQRDWGQVVGPALTTVGMICLIISRKLRRRGGRDSH